MGKVKDKIVLIALTGTISAAIANTFGYLTKLVDPKTAIMPEVAAELFWHKPYIHTFLGLFSAIFGAISSGVYTLLALSILWSSRMEILVVQEFNGDECWLVIRRRFNV